MADLKNPRLIYLKGVLFLVIGVLCFTLLLVRTPQWETACLLCVAIWSFCRFYYFAFYVVQHYVDDQYRFAGLIDFLRYVVKSKTVSEPASDKDPKSEV